jgi:2-dehydropantoate 2-reductase
VKIAVFGTGGVGGYFGGLLAQTGHEVTFIARGPHLDAIQQNGLRVNSVNGDFLVFPARATDNPAEVEATDYVIVAVKHFHLKDAAEKIRPMVGKNTTVIPLLNGVDAHEILAQTVGEKSVVGGLCAIVSFIESPGVIRQESKLRRVVLGELDQTRSERVERLVQAWAVCGAEAIHAGDILLALWTKFLFIASFGGVGSLVGLPAGAWRDMAETRALYVEALREIEQVARASGVILPNAVVENALAMTDGFEASTTSSMQRDVAAGNLFELEAFSGKVVRTGEALGIPTPVHRAMDALLRPRLNLIAVQSPKLK